MQIVPSSLCPAVRHRALAARQAVDTAALLLLLLFALGSGTAQAVSGAEDPPVYNPASKSYFQLLKTTGKHGNWPASLEQAYRKTYKGVRGRLAVIDTPETHEFIMRNFDVSSEMSSRWKRRSSA